MELGELPGVKSVAAEIASRQVTVEWDTPTTWDKIKATLVEINYPPTDWRRKYDSCSFAGVSRRVGGSPNPGSCLGNPKTSGADRPGADGLARSWARWIGEPGSRDWV
jgi:hypothetical protein